MKVYNKLVRDKIPDIIKSKQQTPVTKVLDDEQYLQCLHEKLFEEANEFVEADDKEELADLLEVVYVIAEAKQIDLNEVEKIRKDKQEKRGGFKNKIYLESVLEQ